MHKFPLKPLLLACLAASCQQALADEVSLGTDVVTARGYASDSFSTPQAIEVVAPEATSTGPAGNLLRGKAGLTLHSDGAWGQNPVLRGLKKESVVVMVDGIRMNSAQPQGALASFMDLGLLDRVEVVKGPGSVLYGSGAMGGVVNLLTPEPRFSDSARMGGRFGLSASSVDHGVAGALLVDASNSEHGLVAGIAGRDVGNYKSPGRREKRTSYESGTALLKYQYQLAEGYVLRAQAQYHQDEDVWYPGSMRKAPNPVLGPDNTLTIHSPKQTRELYGLGLDAELAGGTLSSDIYRQEVYREIRGRSSGAGRNLVTNDVSFVTHGLRSQWNGAVGSHWLTLGGETWQMKGDPERYNYQPPAFAAQRTDPFKNGKLTSFGIFVQDEFALGTTELTAGARYDRNKGTAKQKGNGPRTMTSGLTRSDNTISWSLGALQPLTDNLNAYASIGQAYRSPDMRERFEDAERGDGYFHVGNPKLKPERSTSYELGLKGRDGLQSYQLAAFYTRIDDYIAGRITGETNLPNKQPVKRTENLSRVVIYGLEGSLEQPLGDFLLDAGFTWLRGKNRQDNEPLYQTPASELRLGIGQPSAQGFSWHGGVRAVAAQNRIAKKFSNGSEDKTSDFVTADINLGYGFGAVAGLKASRVDLQLSNLTNKKYHEHLTDGLSGYELKAPGRGATLAVSGSF